MRNPVLNPVQKIYLPVRHHMGFLMRKCPMYVPGSQYFCNMESELSAESRISGIFKIRYCIYLFHCSQLAFEFLTQKNTRCKTYI